MQLQGDEFLQVLSALANPHRLRIIASLSRERNYVSQLAKEVKLSRPLLHMHLKLLEAAGLVSGSLELSTEGRAMKYYEVTPFVLQLTPAIIAETVQTLSRELGSDTNNETEG